MEKSLITFLSLSLAVLLLGCDPKDNFKGEHNSVLSLKEPTVAESNPLDSRPKDESELSEPNDDKQFTFEQLSFENIKYKILEPYCINCHTGKHLNYALHPIVKLASQDMLARMEMQIPIRRMPPGPNPLAPELIDLFEAWVFSGSPEFADPNLVIEVKPNQLRWFYIK